MSKQMTADAPEKSPNRNETVKPVKKLWLAIVEHHDVPGVDSHILFQQDEPGDNQVLDLAAARSGCETKDLEVIGIFNLSYVIEIKPQSRKAMCDAMADDDFKMLIGEQVLEVSRADKC